MQGNVKESVEKQLVVNTLPIGKEMVCACSLLKTQTWCELLLRDLSQVQRHVCLTTLCVLALLSLTQISQHLQQGDLGRHGQEGSNLPISNVGHVGLMVFQNLALTSK